jgi:hypothetical protein
MASTAIFINAIAPGKTKGKGETRRAGSVFAFHECASLDLLDGHDFPAIVGAAGHAGMVRLLDLLALRAEREAWCLEVLVGTPLVPAGL